MNDADIKKMEAMLLEKKAEIKRLQARVMEMESEKQTEMAKDYEDTICILKEKWEIANKKFKRLSKSNNEAFDEIKSGVQKSWEELKTALDKAVSMYRQ